jgi:1-phosphofructokinase family hexose kinase
LIITVTINPAIDRNVSADRLVFEDRAYILSRSESAGGRGINASAVLHSFGAETLSIATCGGKSGKRFEELLRGLGFPVELVRIKNEIRTNLTISDKHGLTVKLNELGPAIEQAELDRLEKAVRISMTKATYLMICGSLPPGVPSHFYCRLIEAAKANNVPTLVDTDGEALQHALESNPTVVSPNQQEAERLLNRALITRTHFHEAAERILGMGAQSVVMSLGARGAVGADGKKLLEAVPPRIDAVCPIGAGDAMAAAFVWAMNEKKDFADSLRWGVAAGTAAACLPGVRLPSFKETKDMYRRVEVRYPS